jgi:lipoprotein-anchoring transpeptidase ErfK/SrfK
MYMVNRSIIILLILLPVSGETQYISEIKSAKIDHSQHDLSNTENQESMQFRIEQIQSSIKQLKQEHEKLLPKKTYLIISTSDNQVYLMKNDQELHRGKCSTGSFVLLKAPDSRQWLFRTPRGQFKVNVKLKDPSWYKPDWAYIEEGKPIPSIYSPARWQDGVLGKFALGFGPAFMIHGTIYKRFLGLPATHGCVRLDDDDMQLIFKKLTHGCKIFIY